MIDAHLDTQLMIAVDDKVGTLADVTGVISGSGINLVAACAYSFDGKGQIMFVTEDNKQAQSLLEEKGYNVRDEEIILLTLNNQPGTMQKVTDKIAQQGIDLNLFYGSVDKEGEISRMVLISEDNAAVMMAIRLENIDEEEGL
ncbi:hypothetical protein MNBD_BACTEROID05-615 [hydrothermal vent metagenome]|uniref:ACT domain-containing protein n=1 Tax=hydrothermal vent metagenome TaxID=652676 RepID=A0A3B0U5R7_9ZZZZ